MPTQTVEEARRELTRWTDDAQIILARVSRVFDEHETLRVGLEGSQAHGAELREQIRALEAESSALRGQITVHETLGIQLRGRITALEADNAAFRARLEALQARHGDLAQLVAAGLRGVLDRVLPEVPDDAAAATSAIPVASAAPSARRVPPAREAALDPVAAPATPEGPVTVMEAVAPIAAPEPIAPPELSMSSMPEPTLGAGWPEPTRDRARDQAVAAVLDDGADDDPARFAIEALEGKAGRDAGEAPADPAQEELTRIMLVDDEPHFTELIAEFLGGRGFDVRIAQTGEEGLAALSEFSPRIVLLDLMMPGIGGMETLRRIKAAQPDTSVIMVTAIDDRDTARKALALGASDYVTKPLTLDFLESVLAVHVPGVLPVTLPGDGGLAQSAASSAESATSFFARR